MCLYVGQDGARGIFFGFPRKVGGWSFCAGCRGNCHSTLNHSLNSQICFFTPFLTYLLLHITVLYPEIEMPYTPKKLKLVLNLKSVTEMDSIWSCILVLDNRLSYVVRLKLFFSLCWYNFIFIVSLLKLVLLFLLWHCRRDSHFFDTVRGTSRGKEALLI